MISTDKLPGNFLYSQQSLSAFEQCPMRFKKRYHENLRWDSVFDIEQKKAIESGMDFHLLARRYFLGIEPDPDSMRMEDDKLKIWLNNLKQTFTLEPETVYLPEHTIIMRSGKLRIQACLDLVVSREDRMEIWDWKTHNTLTSSDAERTRKRLKNSLQTRVYLFMLREQAGSGKRIRMNYWQPEPLGVIASMDYDTAAHEENQSFLESRICDIEEYDWKAFNKRLYSKNCRRCEFNWLCNGPAVVNNSYDESSSGLSTGEDDIES